MYSVHCSIVKMNQKLRSNKKLPPLISIMPIISILGKKKNVLVKYGQLNLKSTNTNNIGIIR